MALVWAAGIIWFAYDFAAPAADSTVNAQQPTDVIGAMITDDDAKKFEHALNGL